MSHDLLFQLEETSDQWAAVAYSSPENVNDLQGKDMAQQGGGDLTHETSFEDLSKTLKTQLAKVLRIPDKMPHKPRLLNNIGNTYLTLFRATGAVGDIDNSVLAYELAAQLLPVTDTRLAGFLHDHGMSVRLRYNLTRTVVDINQAISSFQKAIQFTPEGDAVLPIRLNNIGNSFHTRFERVGELSDISDAISSLQKAIQLTPEGHEDLPGRLNNLGASLHARFEHTGDLTHLSEAISLQTKSVRLTPEGHPDLPVRLYNVGISFRTRFEHTGDLHDISEATSSHQKCVRLIPNDHADLPARLNGLAVSLHVRFKRTGDLADISEALVCQRKSIQLAPKGHAELPTLLNGLAISLQTRFERVGNLADISEAIITMQKSIQLMPKGHADLPSLLNNLGVMHQTRFERMGDLADISEAVSVKQKSVTLTPEGHADLPIWLNNLGVSLQSRFERTGILADISEAISAQQKSVKFTPENHAELPSRLSNLGAFLRTQFNRTGDLADISGAISLQQRAVWLTPEGHSGLPTRLNNLAASLQTRFKRTGDFADTSEAISSLQKSVTLTPEGHPDLTARLHNLGISYAICFKQTRNAVDVQSAISAYRRAATSVSGPPSTRLAAAKYWAYWSQRNDRSQLLEAYHTAIHLISQLAGLEQTIHSRHTNLTNISDLSASAAAAAFNAKRYDLALGWLEQGRCLVWSQLNDLRTPIDDLCAHSPALANDIVRVSKSLENAGSRAEPAVFTKETSMATKMSIQDVAYTHIKMAQEWDQLLVKVRAIPQFEDFLRPASSATLLRSIPGSGHVVVINIHQSRSDGLVLTLGAKEPLHIPLPEFSYEKANTLRHQLKKFLLDSKIRMRGSELDDTRGSRRYMPGIADILRQLWTFVVKPILDGLGYSVPASKTPRIWWCVTGPLAFLPIHAAGIYSPAECLPGIHTTLSDFAVSSYTPTVRSLVNKKQNSRDINQEKMGLLMISQPDTPKMCRIPGTTVEVEAIQRLLANHQVQYLRLDSSDATVNRVKTSMDTHSCIHFACHASQDTTKPLQSGFYLYDGRLELSEIIKEHLIGVDLAFLSACQTSTGDEKLSEEAVHLAGGMLAAGYRGVIATMWSIQDNYGPKIAEEFYKNLISHGANDENGLKRLSSDGAAHALHYATQQLRKILDNSESSLLTWVPYVHFGL